MGTPSTTGIERWLPYWLRFSKKTQKSTNAKSRDPILGKKAHPVATAPRLPTYEEIHDAPSKPIRRREEQRLLESVDVIMAQVRKKLYQVEPYTVDLIAVEHNIRSCCILTATTACRAMRYGDDKVDIERMARGRDELLEAAVGAAHGPNNKVLVRILFQKARIEALYYRRALKPCDIRLGTYFKEDPSQYRMIGLSR